MSDKMREEFESWAKVNGLRIERQRSMCGGDMGRYDFGPTQAAMEVWCDAWQESRAAMEREGWQLVPRIPTDVMKKAFHQADSDWEDGYAFDDQGNRHDSPVYQWIAMLNAAPKP